MDEETFNFWDKIKFLFTDPNIFFDKTRSEQGIKNSLTMYLIIAVIMTGAGFLLTFVLMSTMPRSMMYGATGLFGFGSYYLSFIWLFLGIAMTFIYSGIVHLLVRGFKGEGSYSNTYNVYTYSMIPYLLISAVPVVGGISIVYSFILMIIGVSRVHNISKGMSALACLIPIILVLGLLFIFLLWALSSLF